MKDFKLVKYLRVLEIVVAKSWT